jgi:Ca2+-binding EF-hand superfamily protein
MVSDVAAEKHGQSFDLLDVDDDGYLERADFELIATRLSQGAGAGNLTIMHEAYVKLWTSLAGELGIDADAKMARDEFIHGLDAIAKSTPSGFDNAIAQIPVAILALYDRDRDGKLSKEEFQAMQAAWGVSKDKTDIALLALELDDDGMICVEYLLAACREFVLSEDLYAPGNWLLGGLAPKPIRYF